MRDTFSKYRIVVRHWKESATKDYQYLKGMIPSRSMQKMEIPGLVAGIGLIIITIVLIGFMVKI